MKTLQTNYILLLSLLAVSVLTFLSFKPTQTSKKYQHMIILAVHADFDDVDVSIDGKEYSHTSFVKQTKGGWDFNPMINLIHQYEGEGWEMQSTTSTGVYHYFWLRKEKE